MMTQAANIFVLCIVFVFSCSMLLSLLFSFLSGNAKYTDENKKLLHLIRTTGLITLLSPLLNCVFSESYLFRSAMETASLFYIMFAGAELVLLVLGWLISLIERVIKKDKKEIRKNRRAYYAWHVFVLLVSLVFVWLFS